MILEYADWQFDVDVAATREHTLKNASDHCMCAYCRNYYETVDTAYPNLRPFLEQFGVNIEGPSELMPFEPTLQLPWIQIEPVEDVISPANMPEFLERMQEVWTLRHGDALVFS